MGKLFAYRKRLVVRVALLMLLMGVLIHGAIYLYQHKVVMPHLLDAEQTKADVLLEAYLPVLSDAIQSGSEQSVQLLISKLQLIANPMTGNPLVDGVTVESMGGAIWGDKKPTEKQRSFISEGILFSSGDTRQMLGFAKLYYSREYFDQLSQEASDSLLQLSLLMSSLSVLLLLILAHYLRPLHRLAESLKEWGVGDNPAQLPEPTPSASREILLVHHAISSLLDDLHSYQLSLEDLVHERTERLQIANTTLEQSHQRIVNQNQAFASLTKNDSVNLPLQLSLDSITRITARTLEIERVSIWLYEDEKQILRCINLYQQSIDQHSAEQLIQVESYPNYFQAVEEERALVIPQVTKDKRIQELLSDYLQPLNIQSLLDAPIRIGNQTIGVVCSEAVGEAHQWTVDEENFAISVADFVALAMESDQRRQAEEDLREHRDHLEELVEERTGELRIANKKLKEEMDVREKLEKVEQFSAFQSGIAEMSATILHNIGNVVTGMQGSVEKSSRHLKTFSKISKTMRMMQQQMAEGKLDSTQVERGLQLTADSIDHVIGEEGIEAQLEKLRQGIFHIGEIISVYKSASKIEINPSRFNLQTMLKDTMQLIQDKFDKYHIALEVKCPADLQLTIPRNPAIQALLNLTKNSVEAILERRQHQPEHSGLVVIEAQRIDQDHIELSVSDDGCGIEPKLQKRIFNHGYTSKDYGSGYGLHSAANFTNSIGGVIDVESTGIDQGATMRLCLPEIDQREQQRKESQA